MYVHVYAEFLKLDWFPWINNIHVIIIKCNFKSAHTSICIVYNYYITNKSISCCKRKE